MWRGLLTCATCTVCIIGDGGTHEQRLQCWSGPTTIPDAPVTGGFGERYAEGDRTKRRVDQVSATTKVGVLNDTGRSSGPHLHYTEHENKSRQSQNDPVSVHPDRNG